MTRCACGNTARLGGDMCGRCLDADAAEKRKTDVMDEVRDAAMGLADGPMRRFGEAVVAWMEERQ